MHISFLLEKAPVPFDNIEPPFDIKMASNNSRNRPSIKRIFLNRNLEIRTKVWIYFVICAPYQVSVVMTFSIYLISNLSWMQEGRDVSNISCPLIGCGIAYPVG
ncbi:uncharacterized protein LOC129971738 [Argiope bruennichi]|uniref:uncharacterized protein LOC129971738 n=1 Tax=Argiope bruennichi TaxID=94029 RepID=UPI0024957C99|nr:uncharacterized protein LOC129971738 [Argiope bruennichi]